MNQGEAMGDSAVAPANPASPRFEVVDFEQLPSVPCPCGTSRRAFAAAADFPLTVHRTEISEEARCHYHRTLTECYYILACGENAAIELDGNRVPLRPGLCVLIRPGVRHRALGRMSVLNIVSPKFTADDEWFD